MASSSRSQQPPYSTVEALEAAIAGRHSDALVERDRRIEELEGRIQALQRQNQELQRQIQELRRSRGRIVLPPRVQEQAPRVNLRQERLDRARANARRFAEIFAEVAADADAQVAADAEEQQDVREREHSWHDAQQQQQD